MQNNLSTTSSKISTEHSFAATTATAMLGVCLCSASLPAAEITPETTSKNTITLSPPVENDALKIGLAAAALAATSALYMAADKRASGIYALHAIVSSGATLYITQAVPGGVQKVAIIMGSFLIGGLSGMVIDSMKKS